MITGGIDPLLPAGAAQRDGKVESIQVDAGLGRLVHGLITRLYSLLPGSTKRFYRPNRDRYYARAAAALCREQEAGWIVFASCPQWAPCLRESNPDARLVLFKRTDWLSAAPRGFDRYLDPLDAVICPYRGLAERIARRFPQLRERIHVVPDGVDLETFRPHKVRSRHRILSMGRISPEGGVHFLVDAFRLLKDRYPDADLVLVGKPERSPRETLLGTPFVRRGLFGPGRTAYSRRILRKARAIDGIILADQVPHEELPWLYATSSVMVLPTLADAASGLVLAEAMASGLPVVASRNGAAAEIVQDGRTGVLIEPGSTQQIVSGVERIFDNRENAARMAEAARARAEKELGWREVTVRCLEAL